MPTLVPGAWLLPLQPWASHRSLPAAPTGLISATIFAHTGQVDIQKKPMDSQVFCESQLAATRSPETKLTVVPDQYKITERMWPSRKSCHLSPQS